MIRLRLFAAVVLAATCALPGHAAPQQSDVSLLLERIADRVARYYHRAQSLVCVETATVQPIDRDWSWEGMARTVESELRVESETTDGVPLPDPRLIRDIRRVNGRDPRARDKKDRAGCTDPDPFSPEPLAFLMPAHRGEYRFTSVRETRERDRSALVLEFQSVNRASQPELVEDPRGHDDCFDWNGPVATNGRIWVDAVTYEVLRVDRYGQGPVDIRVGWPLQRKYGLPSYVTLDRDDLTIRFKEIAFKDPDEIVLLPESIDSLTVLRSGLQSTRRTSTYRDYRRFLTASRVRVKGGG